jgi:4-hydroxy-4-methyl-2-oxoglutarate aldolase
LNVGLPVYSQGSYAQDRRLRGRVVDYRCEIEFANGARVAPGDLIVGDIDGGLTIPYGSADAIVHSALAKVKGEEMVRRMIESGERTQDIFDKTGIM